MRTQDIDVQDGKGRICVAVRCENFTRLRDYLKDCEKVFAERDKALEELATLQAQFVHTNIVPDKYCKQKKCANATTGCLEYCHLDELARGHCVITEVKEI